MDLTKNRWLEVQFYYICTDILTLRNNIMDVMDVIDNFAIFGEYSSELIKPIAQEILSSIGHRPSKQEFVLLCHMHNVSTKEIKRRTNIHNRTLYELLEENKKEPRLFYPRLQPEQITLIEKFLETFHSFRKVGLYD